MKDLTQGSVTKHLLQMTGFLAISMVVQTLYLLADLYWVGHLGKEAIAAVGLAGNFTMLVLALTQMLGVGTTTLISQATGRKDQLQAEVAFNQSFVMSVIVAAALGVFSFLLRDFYCDALGADALTASLAKTYLLWFIPGLLLQFPLVALGSALRATGIIKPTVGLQVLSVVLNIILAPLFIFGIGPFPKLARYWSRISYLCLNLRRRCFDDTLFQTKLPLPSFPFCTVPAANQNLEGPT
jgi:Na+-driven multidrug efflux pump